MNKVVNRLAYPDGSPVSKIRALRRARGWPVWRLAELSRSRDDRGEGLSPSTIWMAERAPALASPRTLWILGRVFGVSVDELRGYIDDAPGAG